MEKGKDGKFKKKRKAVRWQEEDAAAGEGEDKGYKPEPPFFRSKPKDLSLSQGEKTLVIVQVPEDVGLSQLNGTLALEEAGPGLKGTLATTSGERYDIQQEDALYAQQVDAFVPAGGKYLKVEGASRLLVLSKAQEVTAAKASPGNAAAAGGSGNPGDDGGDSGAAKAKKKVKKEKLKKEKKRDKKKKK